jgi:hypothetical protein
MYGFTNDEYTRASECDGTLCSDGGYRFGRCVVKGTAIAGLSLDDAITECHFVEPRFRGAGAGGSRNSDNMHPKQKRNATYWWIATSVYGVYGKGKRMKLPDCTVLYTRRQYPNKDDHGNIDHDNYVGFKAQ